MHVVDLIAIVHHTGYKVVGRCYTRGEPKLTQNLPDAHLK